MRDSNYLILLAVPDEARLLELTRRIEAAGVAFSLVREPDLEDEATALAVAPSAAAGLFGNLPLFGRDLKEVVALPA